MTITQQSVSRKAASRLKPHRHHRRRRTGANLVAIVAGLIWVFPTYWMVNTAFKPRSEIMTAVPLFFPKNFSLANFAEAFSTSGFISGLRNSAIVAIGSVLLGLVVGILAAAALSRFRFRGRRSIMVSILAVQMLPGTALLIPMFLLFNSLNLLSTYIGLILAYVALVLPFSIWVLRGFFIAIPYELEEAAMIDGAGTVRILWSILFPLVMPGAIATSIFAFIVAWNDYLIAYVFMKDQNMYTLPVWLASFSNPITGTDFGGQMAASLLFSLPVVIFFLFIQRNLVTGLSAGAVKG